MNRTYPKMIVGGILFGLAIYFVPFFILKVFVLFGLFASFAWLFRGRRAKHRAYRWAMVDRIRSMSDEEFEQFKERRGGHCADHAMNSKTEDQ